MEQQRRRIDIIMSPDFVADLDTIEVSEMRERRAMAADVETELSFYRRLLHGRMDLLNFELAKRRGEETRTLIEALADILGAGEKAGGQVGRVRGEFSPDLPDERRRPIDDVLEDDFLTRMPDLDDEDLLLIQRTLTETEAAVSEQRRAVQERFDLLQARITGIYRDQVTEELSTDS